MRLSGEGALVTGGASGIGAAVCRRLRAEGAAVVVVDRDREGAEAVAASVGGLAIACDVTSRASVEAMIEEAETFAPLSIVAPCAGITFGAPFLEIDPVAFGDLLDVNLLGTFHVCQAAARHMARRGRGAIVTIASVTGFRATSGRAAYAASKGGVIMLTRAMAVDLASCGIRANCVAPGAIETPLTDLQHAGPAAAIRERWKAQTPQERYGNPEEVSAAVAFLASRDASFITGEVLAVDGGFLAAGMIFDPTGGRT
jgi:NAD(P)-dependent dehydrogenase (short-subunit alcohol dehydrogenase family)